MTIFTTSYHVLVSRNIFRSPFFEIIKKNGVKLVIAVPEKKKEYFEKEFGEDNIIIEGVPNQLNRLDDFFKDLSHAAIRTRALKIMRKRKMGIERPLLQRLLFFAPLIRGLIPKLYRLFIKTPYFEKLLEKYKPDIVFSTDVMSATDIRLLLEAKRKGVKNFGMVRSWDNLTTKGGFRVIPDTLIVQNEITREEAIHLHGIKESIIEIVGIPHYDRYKKPPEISRDQFLKSQNIPEKSKYIVYAPIGDRIVKVGDTVHVHTFDKDMVREISKMLGTAEYLIVRLPPTDTATFDLTDLSNVRIQEPGVRFGEGVKGVRSSEMDEKDDDELFLTIFYSNGIVNPFSSLCVDALFMNRPVIVPNFDTSSVKAIESIKLLQQFEHFVPIIKADGVDVVRNFGELKNSISKYMNNPFESEEQREKIAKLECFSLDGKSSERLFEALRVV